MFGFNILENFNYPYAAKTITEFWRRWHISLSSWFKDYLYIPLGGNRKGETRTVINLFAVFFITGLWHGASINFVFWGLGHGTLLFIEKMFGGKFGVIIKNKHAKNILMSLYTMTSVIVLWVFFRLDMRTGFNLLLELCTLNSGSENAALFIKIVIDKQFVICFIAAAVFSFPWWRRIELFHRPNTAFLRHPTLIALLVLSICSIASNSYNPFIYFRF
jgi:alginate O-acetyltransferase complex protein AlgI